MTLTQEPGAPSPAGIPPLPEARGELSAFLLAHLRRPVHGLTRAPVPSDHALYGDDTQLFLYLCYELHYRGLPGVADDWEWEPSLLELRRRVEKGFEEALVERVGSPSPGSGDIPAGLAT